MNLRPSQTHLPEQMKLKLVDHFGSQAWIRIAADKKKKRGESLNEPPQMIDNFLLACLMLLQIGRLCYIRLTQLDESEVAVLPSQRIPSSVQTLVVWFWIFTFQLIFPTDVLQSVKRKYHRKSSPGNFGAVAPSWSQSMAAVSSYTSLVS